MVRRVRACRGQGGFPLLAILCLCLVSGSCSESPQATKPDSPLSKKLRRAESVAVELHIEDLEIAKRPLDKTTIGALADAFADAVVDQNPEKWEVIGELHVVVDGKTQKWLLHLHPKFEGKVRVTASEYYRGLDSARPLSLLNGD
jgi:hypothetical protein